MIWLVLVMLALTAFCAYLWYGVQMLERDRDHFRDRYHAVAGKLYDDEHSRPRV